MRILEEFLKSCCFYNLCATIPKEKLKPIEKRLLLFSHLRMISKPINILLVEDDIDYAALLLRLVRNGKHSTLVDCTVKQVVTLDAAIAQLNLQPVDVILLDLTLPGIAGLDTLARMQQAAPAIAIVVLTAAVDEELTMQALQAGAEDYLIKGQFSKDILLRSISYAYERKQSRNALLANERRFRSLIENSSDMVIIVTPALVLTYASPSIATLLGYNSNNTVGSNLLNYVHAQDVNIVKDTLATAQQCPGVGVRATNLRIQHADGSWRILSAIMTSLLADPAVQGIVVNARDVTEQQQAEEVMRKAQRLESAGLLASGIAHDLNNLLTNIIAQNALALSKLPTESPARVHIGKTNSVVNLAVSMTRQLLAYAGKAYLQVEATQLNLLLQKSLPLLEAALAQSIELRLDLAKQLPTIDADVGQIQQAIMNLVINAAEAIYPKPGQITITTQLVEVSEAALLGYIDGKNLRAGLCVALEVNDNGRGMDATTSAHIFEPFFSTKPHGHGLGLPAALGILRAHRGALWIHSEAGQGTQVRLLFPLGRLQSQSALEDNDFNENINGAALLIDDEKLLLESLADLLGAAGLQTLTTFNGKQGIELFKQYHDKIGVVVLDMKMPIMDGAETLRQLQTLDSEIEVIIISAYAIPQEIQPWIDQQKVSFMAKPFDIDALLSKIVSTVITRQ